MPNFGSPSPLLSPGIFTNGEIDSDYKLNGSSGIIIYNDSKMDGDSLLFLEIRPEASGQFGPGFAKDFYYFQENKRNVHDPSKPPLLERDRFPEISDASSSRDQWTYAAPITFGKDLEIQLAVVFIQDNESDTRVRRTCLGSGNDTRNFSFDNKEDTIFGAGGNDMIRSGGGNDIVFGGDGNDTIYGDAGNDYLFGNRGNDRLFGGEGSDWLDGGLGNDRLEGGNGNDTYVVDSLRDEIIDSPGTGIETVRSSVNWTLQAGLDHLFLTGSALVGKGNNLNNFIRGNDFDNLLEGGSGDDVLFGDDFSEGVLTGNSSDLRFPLKFFVSYSDFLAVLDQPNDSFLNNDRDMGGNDKLFGGSGNDKLFGWSGNDTLYGGEGNDWLFGGSGNDRLFGGVGDDRLDAGRGADVLTISHGNDSLIGGEGADTFRFNQFKFSGRSTIQDFKPGEDVIEISKSAFRQPTLSDFSFNAGVLSFRGNSLATIQSSSAFDINQSVKLV